MADHCNWLQFIPPHSTKKLGEIEARQLTKEEEEGQQTLEDIEYLLNYVDFLKGNLRALRNGLN